MVRLVHGALQRVALVELQMSIALEPAVIEDGDAVRFAVGAGAMTTGGGTCMGGATGGGGGAIGTAPVGLIQVLFARPKNLLMPNLNPRCVDVDVVGRWKFGEGLRSKTTSGRTDHPSLMQMRSPPIAVNPSSY